MTLGVEKNFVNNVNGICWLCNWHWLLCELPILWPSCQGVLSSIRTILPLLFSLLSRGSSITAPVGQDSSVIQYQRRHWSLTAQDWGVVILGGKSVTWHCSMVEINYRVLRSKACASGYHVAIIMNWYRRKWDWHLMMVLDSFGR